MRRSHQGRRANHLSYPRKAPPGTWQGRARVWVDISGAGSVGPGKFALLQAIDSTHTLAAAARRLRMSYRLAWQHLRDTEQRTGIRVVERQRGGREGGAMWLTTDGEALLRAYNDLCADVREHIETVFGRRFAAWSG